MEMSQEPNAHIVISLEVAARHKNVSLILNQLAIKGYPVVISLLNKLAI